MTRHCSTFSMMDERAHPRYDEDLYPATRSASRHHGVSIRVASARVGRDRSPAAGYSGKIPVIIMTNVPISSHASTSSYHHHSRTPSAKKLSREKAPCSLSESRPPLQDHQQRMVAHGCFTDRPSTRQGSLTEWLAVTASRGGAEQVGSCWDGGEELDVLLLPSDTLDRSCRSEDDEMLWQATDNINKEDPPCSCGRAASSTTEFLQNTSGWFVGTDAWEVL